MLNQDIGRGRGVYISTYGCQMNVNDTERMMSLLEMMNFVPVESPEKATVIIVNSCSVREKPVHKVASEVGKYKEMKLLNPDIRVGVTGCVAQQEKDKIFKVMPVVDFVCGTDAIDQLPEILAKTYVESGKAIAARFEHEKPYTIETLVRNPGVAVFVNITKGCDNFCTFCVVPFTRGRERSRSLKELIEDIRALTARGVKEVTLIGQNVNSYESACGTNFAQLLRAVAEDTDIRRIRYTTSHPKDFNQELVDISQRYREKIMDYIHLPAQSGNDEVLQRMNRGYTRREYLDKVQMIRQAIPGVTLSTDIIVGFPGESEAQYEDTMTLLQEVRYENAYTFEYSPRPFTKAARFTDQIPDHVKRDRLVRMIAKQRAIEREIAPIYEQRILEVLVENKAEAPGQVRGRSTQNKLVYLKGGEELIGQFVNVKVTQAFPNILRAELIH